MDQPPSTPPAPPPPRITFEEIVVWLDERRKWILAGIALVGIGGLVVVVRDAGVESREYQAAAAVFNLQARHQTNDPALADLQALVPATTGTGLLPHVKLREASSLYAGGKYAEAQAAFEAFTRDFSNHPLLPEASYGAAVCLEAQGRAAEALTRYQEVATRFPDSPLVNRARLGQARVYEHQGDATQAYRIYRDLAAAVGGGLGQFGQTTPLQMEASIAVRRLTKANPALLETNTPPAITPTNLPMALPAPAGS